MACDMFSSLKAYELLNGKFIYFFGSSNMRALYKDLVWLLVNGTLVPTEHLKRKNELNYAGDVRVSNDTLHSGRNYQEIREFNINPFLKFQFITRLFLPPFIESIKNLEYIPDVIVINSCVWDLTRWGVNGVEEYRKNLRETFSFLRSELPKTRIIWITTYPVKFESRAAFLTPYNRFMRNMLPWHIVFANKCASDVAKSFGIDVLDLHYHFRLLINLHAEDGIHWKPSAMRLTTNLLLTHIALIWERELPGMFRLEANFLEHSTRVCDDNQENISAHSSSAENKQMTETDNEQASLKPGENSTISQSSAGNKEMVADSNTNFPEKNTSVPQHFTENKQIDDNEKFSKESRENEATHQSSVESEQMAETDKNTLVHHNNKTLFKKPGYLKLRHPPFDPYRDYFNNRFRRYYPYRDYSDNYGYSFNDRMEFH